MSDELSIFGLPFQIETVGGAYNKCTNNVVGTFYSSCRENFSRGNIGNEYFFKVLSVIYEKSLAKRPILFRSDDEKEDYANFQDGRSTSLTSEEILSLFPKSIFDKQSRALVNLYNLNNIPGKEITEYNDYTFFTDDTDESNFLLNSMNKKNLIDAQILDQIGGDPIIESLQIGENGGEVLEQLILNNSLSKRVFVAMWFDDQMNRAFTGISNALQSLGFEPIRIDLKEHNNEISGEILYEISRSRFIIADVTGQRHGVYFEAGYALGIKIPVIWSCRKDNLKEVHFDTRQYSHVVWENETELEEKIINRVKGTILID